MAKKAYPAPGVIPDIGAVPDATCHSGELVSKPVSVRQRKQEATRNKLLQAAAQQIGLHGYAGASIHKITTAAHIANGTFYNYFKSQQDLFDQLLPEMGSELLDQIRSAIKTESNGIAREELGFRAFFDYVTANPSFYRILNEAQIFAPDAYREHMQNMANGYMRALKSAKRRGELRNFSEKEMEVIVYILLSARNYLSYRFSLQNGKLGRIPEWISEAYIKFVSAGISSISSLENHLNLHDTEQNDPEIYLIEHCEYGEARLSMHVRDQHLDQFGQIERSAIVELIDRTCSAAAVGDLTHGAQLLTLTTNFFRPSHAQKIVAHATLQPVNKNTTHGTVEIHEASGDGSLIATGSFVFSTEKPRVKNSL